MAENDMTESNDNRTTTNSLSITEAVLSRAQGSLLGQLSGDALGSLVEFETPEKIRELYPEGVRFMEDGGAWKTVAGQPTDDSEMALALAHSLVEFKRYDPKKARDAYLFWIRSGPFDCGDTVASALIKRRRKKSSQANGAMMRVSPLGIFGANHPLGKVIAWAMQDAMITHPNPICLHANALYTAAIAHAIRTGCSAKELFLNIVSWARKIKVHHPLMKAIVGASEAPPESYIYQEGWVLIAFRNALWQLLHAENTEEGVIDTVNRGGDTDTNGAICGALLGAVHGRESIPKQWLDSLLDCRPSKNNPRGARPRPECFWPVDALPLAEQLVTL